LLSRRHYKDSGLEYTNPDRDNDNKSDSAERTPDVYDDATARATSYPLMKLSG
jgi:hypothetical protein